MQEIFKVPELVAGVEKKILEDVHRSYVSLASKGSPSVLRSMTKPAGLLGSDLGEECILEMYKRFVLLV